MVCRPAGLRRNGGSRSFIEILGNTDAYLHAHVWPRYEWEPAEYVVGPVHRYPIERWTEEQHRFSEAEHGELKSRIAATLLELMATTL